MGVFGPARPISDTPRADRYLLGILFHIPRNSGCTCMASGSPATRITRLFDVIWNCQSFAFMAEHWIPSMYKYDSATLFLFLLLTFSSSVFFSHSFVTERSLNYPSCWFCGTPRLPLRRTAAAGLPAPGSRLCTFISRCHFGSEPVLN